jgi:hypothetical protein
MVNMDKTCSQMSILRLKVDSADHAVKSMNFYSLGAIEGISFIVSSVAFLLGALSGSITLKIPIWMG